MRRVALIYNPASGQHSSRRASSIENVKAVLAKAGVEADSLETHAPGSAKVLAAAAVRQGHDAVLACGGDGTVHEVLQGLVHGHDGTRPARSRDSGIRGKARHGVRGTAGRVGTQPRLNPGGSWTIVSTNRLKCRYENFSCRYLRTSKKSYVMSLLGDRGGTRGTSFVRFVPEGGTFR